jgi:curved DNA-binding protein
MPQETQGGNTMKFRDYYEILGVTETATADEIKRAYRKKARQYHPDVSKEDDAEEQFKLVGEAYEVLRDPARRQEYDQLKKHGYRNGDEFHGGGNWQGQWQPGANPFSGAGGGDFSDFFNAIFGSMGQAGAQPGQAGPHGFERGFERGFQGGFGADFGNAGGGQNAASGSDVRIRVRVSLEQAYKGGKTTLKVPAKDGNGQRSLSVNIPAGVVDGQQLRLRGQGRISPMSARAGDLLLTIEIKEHELFTVDGADVLLQVPVTPLESLDGVTLAVPTLGGEVSLKVPPRTQSGTRLRLRGRGLPASSIGDQYVTIQIALPSEITPKQRELLREFDALAEGDLRSWQRGSTPA